MGIALEHLQTFVAADGRFLFFSYSATGLPFSQRGIPKAADGSNDAPPCFPRSLMTFIGKGDSAAAYDLI